MIHSIFVSANSGNGTTILILAMMPWYYCLHTSNDDNIMLFIYIGHISKSSQLVSVANLFSANHTDPFVSTDGLFTSNLSIVETKA